MESESARLAMALNFVPQYAQREQLCQNFACCQSMQSVARATVQQHTRLLAAMGTVFPHFCQR